MKIDPNRPAFPGSIAMIHNDNGITAIDSEDRDCPGLPIRLHLAAMAMQGLACSDWGDTHNSAQTAHMAVAYADALIAEYNRTEEKP
jgi:hypothetical protein